jgi:leucine-rich repeat protein SHOC2
VLVVEHNDLTELPESLFNLPNLAWLLVAHNKISQIPAAIELAHELRLLSLSHNQLRDLPMSLGRMAKLETLFVVRGNPLDLLPREIVEGGNQSVLWWLRHHNHA